MKTFLVLLLSLNAYALNPNNKIVLDGKQLTLDQVREVANGQKQVELDATALNRMQKSFDLLVEATEQNISMYGVNIGVGGNAGETVFQGSLLDPANQKLSETFNARNIRASSAGHGADVDKATVRATMLIRLNDFLIGDSGARPEVARIFAAFLNNDITPVVPSKGSVGEADLGMLSHIGLATMGEGEVDYKGARLQAKAALLAAGLTPLKLYGVDSLAIMSSNAYSEAMTILGLQQLRHLARVSELVYATSMEAMQETVMPLLPISRRARLLPKIDEVSERILQDLEGSYLLSLPIDNDFMWSLSFGNAPNHIATLWSAKEDLESLLEAEVNSSTNNPSFFVRETSDPDTETIRPGRFISGKKVSGYYLYTTGYEPFHWSVKIDLLKIVLNQLSIDGAARTFQLDNPALTGLGNFLSPGNGVLAFSELQKVIDHLRLENQRLSLSNISNGLGMAGGSEEVASYAPQSALDLLAMTDNLYALLGLELMHSAQAVDLRQIKAAPGSLAIGKNTAQVFREFRKVVSFLDEDRPLTPDIRNATEFVKSPVVIFY